MASRPDDESSDGHQNEFTDLCMMLLDLDIAEECNTDDNSCVRRSFFCCNFSICCSSSSILCRSLLRFLIMVDNTSLSSPRECCSCISPCTIVCWPRLRKFNAAMSAIANDRAMRGNALPLTFDWRRCR